MNEHDDLISRLRAFGRRPVDTDLARRHLAALAGPAGAGPARFRAHRLRVVAAFTVGLLAGTTGLATAGALPNGAQEIAHHTLGSVGVNVPHGDRYQGPECGGVVKNHGQYVRSQPKGSRAEAAASRCGKPLSAGDGEPGDGSGAAPGKAGGCQGPPPWAGKGKPDKAAKAARKAACGDEQDGDDDKAGQGPKSGDDQKSGEDETVPAPGAVTGAVPAPETTSTTTTTATTEPPSTTTSLTTTTPTTAAGGDTPSTTVGPGAVPGLGS